MKFLRYLNPFFVARTIRELRLDLADARTQTQDWFKVAQRESQRAREARAEAEQLREIAEVQDQAIEAHMAERADLKAEVENTDRAGLFMTGQYLRARLAAVLAIGRVRQLEAEVREQAGEVLTVVGYVKQVEQALTAGGITIEDGEHGPLVVVNQDVFLGQLATGTFKVIREDLAAA